MIKVLNGVKVEMTPDEIAAWAADQATCIPPSLPAKIPVLWCLANLSIADTEVIGIETATGLQTAVWVGTGLYRVFFTNPMVDLNFIACAQSSSGRANVSQRALDFIEITITGDDGQPADPAELSIQIFKAQ